MRQLRNFRAPTKEDISSAAQKYDGMNATQLNDELMRAVASAKQDGTFSEDMLDSFVDFVSSSLDDGARQRLNELVQAIKSEGK
ncbi:MAG: hypothetical protein J1G04_02990 [Clostridiales bacterium]|nr:hypothetical protein [Clostridiales bacterium]